MKNPVELNSLLSKFFCYITRLPYELVKRDTGRLANEAITSNPIVSSKQKLNGLKIVSCLGTKFHFKQAIFNFGTKVGQKCISGQKRKTEHDHWLLRIRISLGTKFDFKQAIFNLRAKFAQKVYFWSKKKKVNIIIEFFACSN